MRNGSGLRLCGAGAVIVLLGAASGVADAAPRPAQPSAPVERCRVTDPRLAELSGLASDGKHWYATTDGGSSLRAYVLDSDDCSVRDVWTNPTNPYDVEDLALGRDGAVWLADIGDNERKRATVALHVLTEDGDVTLYRLTFPDGPHDAEALLLDKAGTPHVVTKEPFGVAHVYRPAGPLTADAPVPWHRAGTVALPTTDTPGGPVAGVGTRLVTGGSVSQDGTLVALRTYTESYLFNAPDGDVVAALRRPPVRVPLPNEAQGEAIAWEPDGTLLSASEGAQPARAVPAAAALARPAPDVEAENPTPDAAAPARDDPPTPPDDEAGAVSTTPAVVIVLGLAALLLYVLGRRRRS